MMTDAITYPAAIIAGLLSFFSPCILPVLPAYFSFITGHSLEKLISTPSAGTRARIMGSTLAFVTGFSIVFILMGASATALGNLVYDYRDVIRVAGGIIIIGFGIHVSGLFRFRPLDFDRHIVVTKRPAHMLGACLVGMAFGAGWSPCVGPLLGSVLLVAGSQETVWQGVGLLSAYSIGMAVPFLVMSAFIHLMLAFLQRIRRWLPVANAVAGSLLVLFGILLIMDRMTLLTA